LPSNGSLLVIIFSVIFAAVSSGGLATVTVGAWFSRRNKSEREEDRKRLETEREKLAAEHDKISAEAAEVALRALRKELDAAYADVEKRRIIIAAQDGHIEELGKTVRSQTKRIVALEDWAGAASRKFEQLGVTDMPPVPNDTNGVGPR
jgi:predicted RNase H-like nuclease (RuvC/YqgF family)